MTAILKAADRARRPQVVKLADPRHDAIAQRGGAGLVAIPHQQHELVAADARDRRVGRRQLRQPRRHVAQQPVAGGMAVGVIDRLETIQVQVQQGELVSVAARRRHGALQREAQAEAIHQPGQRVAPRQPVAVALGLHGRHQHAIEAVRRHRHAGQVERQLHADDPQAVLAGEPGQGSARPQAHADHQRGQARRAEIAETDAAHHGGGGQAGQDRRDPVAAGHADERAVAHAARPQHGQHDIGVGMGGPAGRGGAARRHQHDGARQAAGQLERQPCDERRLRQADGDDQRHQHAVEHAAHEDRNRAEQASEQRLADVVRHVPSGIGQPAGHRPGRGAVEAVGAVHAAGARVREKKFRDGTTSLPACIWRRCRRCKRLSRPRATAPPRRSRAPAASACAPAPRHSP
ncbi:Uncharacterised protein [Bordetella pertussis]|nr:Uncharacterised protein [Bordetella pertussis]